ncbi:MFS transporter [Natrialbaceae archaeon AArc-T1-2]|uniref:MFS transporter n=1 Tax=Natrialbaceae archaeon AArc-T1-2 TaxID=3053904 RepID=UPI00255ACE6A|nr:MFS transporter [Natrialbaceae archaeon AArc-T1-2]WIV67900.1 MFS transporter [Natrialbaceae archaeon AArc-T1-2]
MYGLSRREIRFALVISSSHFTQHVYYRLLPPLIPVLAVALEYPLWQLGLLISVYQFGMGIVQAPLGVLSDQLDRRYLLPTGLAITGGAYIGFAFAPTLGDPLSALSLFGYTVEGGFIIMSLAMLLVGVGLAVVHPVGYPMITDNVSDTNKGKVLGVFGASSKLGDAAAPAVIAVLILALAWEQIILLFGVAGVLYGISLYVVLRSDDYETVPAGKRTEDGAGSSGDTVERRGYLYPMVAIYLFFISTHISTRGLNTFLPAFLVAVYAYSFEIVGVQVGAESVANMYFSGMLIAGAAMQLVLGGLTDAYDSRQLLLYCMAIATGGMIALALFDLSFLLLLVVVAMLGVGLYGVNPARDALVSDFSPPDYEGRSFGYIFTAGTLTVAPLPAVIGYVLETAGMRMGFLWLAVGPVLAAGCIGLLYSNRIYLESDVGACTDTSD